MSTSVITRSGRSVWTAASPSRPSAASRSRCPWPRSSVTRNLRWAERSSTIRMIAMPSLEHTPEVGKMRRLGFQASVALQNVARDRPLGFRIELFRGLRDVERFPVERRFDPDRPGQRAASIAVLRRAGELLLEVHDPLESGFAVVA